MSYVYDNNGYQNQRKELMAQLAAKIAEFEAKLQEAVDFAKEHNLSFSISGPAYGMGGMYNPENLGNVDYEDGWQASSYSC